MTKKKKTTPVWVMFDDGGGDLRPVCDLRASFELRTGALTTAERIADQVGSHPAALWAGVEVAEVLASRHTEPINRVPDTADHAAVLLVNGRCGRITFELPREVGEAVVDESGAVAAALLDRGAARRFLEAGCRLGAGDAVKRREISGVLITRPWQVLQQAQGNLEFDLDILARRLRPLEVEPAPRVTVVGKHRVMVGRDTVVHPHVVFDTTDGPIVIDDGAVVRSMSVMVGPGYVGRGSIVVNHAHIRGHTVIGPWCKVGGEVNNCIFQGFANKAHSGYLGNSFVGEWVNLGADTVTSNLKNTYGEVRVALDPGQEQRTGMQFLGTIFGDHVKTAIGTRMLTGSVVHTGAMLAVGGFPPKCTPRFAFVTDKGQAVYELAKFFEVAEAVMKRREVELSPALRRRIEELHAAESLNRRGAEAQGAARK